MMEEQPSEIANTDELPYIEPIVEEEIDEDAETSDLGVGRYRGATNDPVFGYLIALALSIGLTPLISTGHADLRYTVAWGVLALFGVLAWLFGTITRIGQETPDSAVWGVSFGVILGAPLLAFGSTTLSAAVDLLFLGMGEGVVLAYLIFVIPIAETLFFRGILQERRAFWIVGLMGTFWSSLLFLPMMNLQRFPVVVLVICLTLLMMNLMYSYVRQRNGLAAAWICQIVVNLIVVFLPYLGRAV